MNITLKNKSLKNKSLKKEVKLNLYSENFQLYNTKNDNYNNIKLLIHKLSNSLKDNQWLELSDDNSNNINYTRSLKCDMINNKYYNPNGTWYSKGEWLLLFIINGRLETLKKINIILAEVNYSKIYKISNRKNNYKLLPSYYKALDKFIDEYGKRRRGKININWEKLCNNKYNGIAIYPMPSENYFSQYFKTNKTLHFLPFWDVSSLCIWNMSSITKHYNLGKFENIDNLISKITEINKIK